MYLLEILIEVYHGNWDSHFGMVYTFPFPSPYQRYP